MGAPAFLEKRKITDYQPGSDLPAIPRIDQTVELARPLRRQTDQMFHVGITAVDPVEGDDIGGCDLVRQVDEVAMMVSYSFCVASPLGFLHGGS